MSKSLFRVFSTFFTDTEVLNWSNSLLSHYNPASALDFYRKLSQNPGHLTSGSFDVLLSVGKSYDLKTLNWWEMWERELLEGKKWELIGKYLGGVQGKRVREFARRVDERLGEGKQERDGREGNVTLVKGMNRVKRTYSFSEASYLSVLSPPSSISVHQMAELVFLSTKSTLSITALTAYLTSQHSHFIAQTQTLSAKERAYLIYSYSLFPLDCSPLLLSLAITDLHTVPISPLDIIFIVNGLSRFPVPADYTVYQLAENILLNHTIPKHKLALAIHAFAKRKLGSKPLFIHFQRLFERYRFDGIVHAQIVNSFLRSEYTDSEFKEKLKRETGKIMMNAEIPVKIKESIQYWEKH